MPVISIRLLLIEDNPGDVRLIKEFLRERKQYLDSILTVASRLDEALRLVDSQPFDLILLDLTLPDAHGLDTLTGLQAQVSSIPIIVTTGLFDEALAVDAVRMGAQDYLVKNTLNGEVLSRSIHYALERANITNELRVREAQYRLLAENITDLIARHAPDSTLRYVSPSCRMLLGYEPEEMVGHKADEFFHPDDLPILDGVRNLSRHTLNTYTITYRIRHKDGSYRWFETTGNVTRDPETQSVLETITVSRDITERYHAAEQMRLLQSAVEHADDAIVVMSAEADLSEAQIRFVNPAFTRLTGFVPEDFLGKKRSVLRDHFSDPEVSKQASAALSVGYSFRGKSSNRRKDGQDYEVEWNIAPIRDVSGTVTHYVCVQRDVTERGRHERALQESEARFQAISNTLPVSIAITRLSDSTILYANDSYCDEMGLPREMIVGRPALDFFADPEDRSLILTELQSNGIDQSREVQIRCADGSLKWVLVSVTRIAFKGETALLSGFHNVTQIKELEQERAFLAAIVESSEDAIIGKTLEGQILTWNKGAERLYGYSADEAIGQSIRMLAPPERPDEISELLTRIKAGGHVSQLETVRITKAGKRVDISLTISPVTGENGAIVGAAAIARDNGERKKVDEALRANEEKLRTLFEVLPVGVSMVDQDQNIVEMNPALARILDISPEELVAGAHLSRRYIRADGTSLPPSEFATAQAIHEQQETFDREIGVINEAGATIWTSVSAVPLALPNLAAVTVVLDVTERKKAEEQLRVNEAKLRTLFEVLPVGVAMVDNNEQIVDMNPALARILDLAPLGSAEGTHRSRHYLHADGTPMPPTEFVTQRVVEERQPVFDVEIGVIKEDGATTWASVSSVPLALSNINRVTVALDVTERKQAEQKLAEERSLLRTLIDNIPDYIYVKDRQSRMMVSNKATAAMLGFATPEEMLGKTDFDFMDRQAAERYFSDEQAILQSGRALLNHVERVTDQMTSHVRWHETTKVPLRDNMGNIVGIVGVGRDITERKRAEQALQQSEELLRAVLDALPIGVMITDSQGQITHINPASQQIWAGAKYLGVDQYGEYKAWWLDSGKPVEAREWGAARAVANLETSLNEELEIERFDGVHRYMLNSAVPILNSDGNLQAVVAVNQDITERKRTERALQLYNQRIEVLHNIDRSILTAQPPSFTAERIVQALIEIIGCDAARIFASHAQDNTVTHLAAYPPVSQDSRDLLRHVLEVYGIPEDVRRGKALLIDDTRTPTRILAGFEALLTAQGARSWIIVPLMVGEQFLGILTAGSRRPSAFTSEHFDVVREMADQLAVALHKAELDEAIQEHTRTLEARVAERTSQLKSAKERIEAILRSTSEAIVVAEIDGRIEQMNPAFSALFGFSFEQGQSMSIFSLVDPASTEIVQRTFDEVGMTGTAKRVEFIGLHRDGTSFHADAALAPVIDGIPMVLICSIRDVTVYKEAEECLQNALEEEKELNKLKTSFTSIVSHEFRTPLAVILSSADLLQKYIDRMDEKRRQEKLDNITRQVRRLINLMDDVLMITRSESTGFVFKETNLDLVTLCQEVIEEAKVGYRQEITIDFKYQGDCQQIRGDEFLFTHILQNLVSNAIKYSPTGGTIDIVLDCSNTALTLRVEDHGIGIPQEHQSRLFEAFRRASNVGQIQGTGIGMTIVKRAVDAYSGRIEFKSSEGQGTTFIVQLPVSQGKDVVITDET